MVIICAACFWASLGEEPVGHPCICEEGVDTAARFQFFSLKVCRFCETGERNLSVKPSTSTYIYSGSSHLSIPR